MRSLREGRTVTECTLLLLRGVDLAVGAVHRVYQALFNIESTGTSRTSKRSQCALQKVKFVGIEETILFLVPVAPFLIVFFVQFLPCVTCWSCMDKRVDSEESGVIDETNYSSSEEQDVTVSGVA